MGCSCCRPGLNVLCHNGSSSPLLWFFLPSTYRVTNSGRSISDEHGGERPFWAWISGGLQGRMESSRNRPKEPKINALGWGGGRPAWKRHNCRGRIELKISKTSKKINCKIFPMPVFSSTSHRNLQTSLVVVMTAPYPFLTGTFNALNEQLPWFPNSQYFSALHMFTMLSWLCFSFYFIPIVLKLFWVMNPSGNSKKGMDHFPRIKCP